MSETQEERRKAGRRRKSRRMHDMLQGKATEEEKQQYDKLLWSSHQKADRRSKERRSGKDRRE